MIDIGANLTHKSLKHDLQEILLNSKKSNVISIIITGTSIRNSFEALDLCNQYQDHNLDLFSTAGIHPHNAASYKKKDLILLEKLLKNKKVVAVGECGLDFDRNFSDPASQKTCFREQLDLAVRTNKPVFVHERNAFDPTIEIMSEFPGIRAVIHCFTGNLQQVIRYLEMGFYIGITGWINDNKKKQHYDAIRAIPLDRLMIETDAPFLSPIKNKRNVPENLKFIVKKLSEILELDSQKIIDATTANSLNFFGLETQQFPGYYVNSFDLHEFPPIK